MFDELKRRFGKSETKFLSYGYHSMSSGRYTVDDKVFYAGQDFRTVERFREYLDCGFSHFFMQNVTYRGESFATSDLKKYMDTVQAAGADKIIIFDYRLSLLAYRKDALITDNADIAEPRLSFADDADCKDYMTKLVFNSQAALEKYVENCVKDYTEHSAFFGILLIDEPSYKSFKFIALIYNAIKKYCPAAYVHCNLLPLAENVVEQYAENYSDMYDAFNKYLAAFIKTVGIDYIQYDDYPIREKDGQNEIGEYHLKGLQMTADFCKEHGLDYYYVTQSTAMDMRGKRVFRFPDKQDMLWQIYHLLGFGIRRIAYFTYWRKAQNKTYHEFFPDGSAFISQDGKKTPLYDIVKDIHKRIVNIQDVLFDYEYENSSVVYGGDAKEMPLHVTLCETREIEGLKVDGVCDKSAFLITHLKNKASAMYMVQNCLDSAQYLGGEKNIAIRLNDCKKAFIFDFYTCEKVDLTDGKAIFNLRAGDAKFIIPIKE